MITVIPDNKKWEDAFISFGTDAAVGRLFRGIIHNLNGVGQTFSMQAELLVMMYRQADKLLAEISRTTSLEEARARSAELREMLARRADLAQHLTAAVKILKETMQRASVLTEVPGQVGGGPCQLAAVVLTEMEFLNSDGFFKHKIRKELSLAEDTQVPGEQRVAIHQILAVLLENASQALAGNMANEPAPAIAIATTTSAGSVEVRITDNGPGIAPDDHARIFEPFFTTREGHLGLGLYLARALAVNSGGSLTWESSGGRTCFALRMPIEGGWS